MQGRHERRMDEWFGVIRISIVTLLLECTWYEKERQKQSEPQLAFYFQMLASRILAITAAVTREMLPLVATNMILQGKHGTRMPLRTQRPPGSKEGQEQDMKQNRSARKACLGPSAVMVAGLDKIRPSNPILTTV